jgi:DNA anti-recombination protein RmuC
MDSTQESIEELKKEIREGFAALDRRLSVLEKEEENDVLDMTERFRRELYTFTEELKQHFQYFYDRLEDRVEEINRDTDRIERVVNRLEDKR